MGTRDAIDTSSASATDAEYRRFCEGVEALCGVGLSHYRQGQMERRLRTFAQRGGHEGLDAYLEEIRRDPAALEGFRNRMTIKVSELFRDPERFEELERDLLPALAASARGGFTAWSAGCSYGAEAYTLAILLSEARGVSRFTVVATDIDTTVLARARGGAFSAHDLRNVGSARLRRWFSDEGEDGGRSASPDLARSIRFGELDLLSDRYPRDCDLILCRNVVIYFKDDAKDQIYRGFYEALRPGGILFVGSTERVGNAREMGWEKAGAFFYRKPVDVPR